jgi:hypothetical protein
MLGEECPFSLRLFKNGGLLGGAFGICLKLEDSKTRENVGGEEAAIPSKMKLKSKLNSLLNIRG